MHSAGNMCVETFKESVQTSDNRVWVFRQLGAEVWLNVQTRKPNRSAWLLLFYRNLSSNVLCSEGLRPVWPIAIYLWVTYSLACVSSWSDVEQQYQRSILLHVCSRMHFPWQKHHLLRIRHGNSISWTQTDYCQYTNFLRNVNHYFYIAVLSVFHEELDLSANDWHWVYCYLLIPFMPLSPWVCKMVVHLRSIPRVKENNT